MNSIVYIIKPLVSVCIPTLNGELYLKEALCSAINQTYRPLEIIVSDDGSSDTTNTLVQETIIGWDIPVKILNHEPCGIGANWNNCVRHASGKYIKFLFQDDILYPNCISEMVALAEEDENIGLVFCERDIIGETEGNEQWIQRFGNLSKGWNKLEQIQEGKELLRQPNFLKDSGNKIGEPTVVLLNRNVFQKVGYFSNSLKQTLDQEFWYRLMPYFKIAYLNKKLAAFRLHKNQTTQQNLKEGLVKEYITYYKVVMKNLMTYLSFKNKLMVYYIFYQLYKQILKTKIRTHLNFRTD